MTKTSRPRLYLIPALLAETPPGRVIPEGVIQQARELRLFFVEDVRTARRYLRKLDPSFPIDDSRFEIVDKNTSQEEIERYVRMLQEEGEGGLISEAGLPAVADPGASLVQMAQQRKIRLIPLSGPSSLMMALMASGMNGQGFTFHGYLPIQEGDRQHKIREIEKESRQNGYAQLFIETPYRNLKLLESLIKTCDSRTRLSISANLTSPKEYIRTHTLEEWKKQKPDLHKIPAVFILQA